MDDINFRLQFIEICDSNKKFNLIKVFVFSSSTHWRHFCSVEADGDITLLLLEFDQLEF
ncbi:hypothetical protein AHAS_Ahas03G0210200 [Arachis hypogaea]